MKVLDIVMEALIDFFFASLLSFVILILLDVLLGDFYTFTNLGYGVMLVICALRVFIPAVKLIKEEKAE